jgi:RNA polymerase sigma-70 factor (ECF subfamily)
MKENVNTLEITDVNADKEEKDLVRQVKLGYRPAFSELVTRYQQRIFKLAYGFFQDRDDAMEIVQETFLRLYRKLDGFDETDERTRFRNWVYRIAYNLCIDFYRKFKKQKADMKELYQFHETTRSGDGDPEERLDRQHFREQLEKSMMRLPKRQKHVFVLRHYSGLKYTEIAGILDLSVGTVKSLYHRSVQVLKKRLSNDFSIPVKGR